MIMQKLCWAQLTREWAIEIINIIRSHRSKRYHLLRKKVLQGLIVPSNKPRIPLRNTAQFCFSDYKMHGRVSRKTCWPQTYNADKDFTSAIMVMASYSHFPVHIKSKKAHKWQNYSHCATAIKMPLTKIKSHVSFCNVNQLCQHMRYK